MQSFICISTACFFKLIFKIIGIGYITEFTADIAEDFGNNIISSKVIIGGKIVICGMALPVIKDLLAILTGTIGSTTTSLTMLL